MVKTERTEVHQMQKAVLSAKENENKNFDKISNSHFGKKYKIKSKKINNGQK